jgi:hypothetical protein
MDVADAAARIEQRRHARHRRDVHLAFQGESSTCRLGLSAAYPPSV